MTIAALILPLALLQGAPSPSDVEAQNRFEHCVAQIERTPDKAYEEGMAWASEGHSLQGYRCAAMALVGEGRYDEGARRLQSLATATSPDLATLRVELLSQAGNAWLLARQAGQARSAFTMALTTVQADPSQQPDLLIDRARAYAMEKDYRHAEEDLSRSLDLRPDTAIALQLRAETRMRQGSFDLAENDINAAITLDPHNVEFYKTRGDIIESRRTGAPVDEQ